MSTRQEDFINRETGEILTGDEIMNIIKDESVSVQGKKIRRSNTQMTKEFGNYFHCYYGKVLSLNMDNQHLVRFLYLCTSLDYNKYIVSGYGKGRVKYKESDLQEILKLGKTEFYKTKLELKKHNLIIIDENKNIKVNEDYILKGSINSKGENTIKAEVVRMFDNAIKEIYESASAIEHKKIGSLIRLLPYINIHHNLVCKNPEEKDIQNIIPFKISEIAELLGYKNITRLKKDLFNITVGGEKTFILIEDDYGKFFVVNPRVYCKSNEMEGLMAISNYFRK